jgi:myo-inositol-hexaphosphate 3-phosphohydrolase
MTLVALGCTSDSQYFDYVTIVPAFEIDGLGKNIDSIAFWEAPDPDNTLMFVTAKGNSLVEVWKYPFANNQQAPLLHNSFHNSPVNGVVVDQGTDLLYISIGEPSSTVSVFKLPLLRYVMSFNKKRVNLKSEPNLTLLDLGNGGKKIYVSADDIVYIYNGITGKYLGMFTPVKGLETMVADNFFQLLYIPDENGRTGVYVYNPDGSLFKKNGVNRFGEEDTFDNDAEGIIVYTHAKQGKDTGEGLIVVADQRRQQTDFEVFDRKSWLRLGVFRIKGVSNTDGIASTQRALPDYPLGIFAAVNNDTSVVGVGWDSILKAMGIKFSGQ